MPQTKILVDSCSYFRLAQNIHPLLSQSFGSSEYTLYAHKDLTAEFKREVRLQTKFDWVMRPEYAENRKSILMIGKKERAEIAANFEYMWEHVRAEQLGPSSVDVRILATAAALNVRMVTDDGNLLKLGEHYGVYTMTTLELLQLMLKERHIDMEKIRQVTQQWIYDNDCPADFWENFRNYFGESPPKS